MAKFEVEFEITGLRLKVKAERDEDVSKITQQLGKQFSGLTQPFAGMVENSRVIEAHAPPASEGNGEASVLPKSAARTGRKRTRKTNENGGSQPIHWQHDAAAWGTPRQSWSAGKKILWTLYVLSKTADQKEVGGPAIAESFNQAFRQFGPLNKPSMPRDLGNLKKKSPAQVMDNPTVSPITWYLTEEGIREAEKLVTEAKGTASGAVSME